MGRESAKIRETLGIRCSTVQDAFGMPNGPPRGPWGPPGPDFGSDPAPGCLLRVNLANSPQFTVLTGHAFSGTCALLVVEVCMRNLINMHIEG